MSDDVLHPIVEPEGATAFVSLAEILTLEPSGNDTWRGYTPATSQRPDIFGGQVASQCLRAAAFTVQSEHVPNSVHCYFLRRGNPALPLDLRVERVRSGRTYASRRVEAVQDDKVIFTMIASFHTPEPGREFDSPPPRDIPEPELIAADVPRFGWAAPFEVRAVPSDGSQVRWWGRVRGAFPDDSILHYCALLYASDMQAGGAAMRAIGFGEGPPPRGPDGEPLVNFGSLDHSVWFHRPPVMTDWVFSTAHPLVVRDSRGLVLGTMYDRNGVHLASLSQEMFLKMLGDESDLPEMP